MQGVELSGVHGGLYIRHFWLQSLIQLLSYSKE